MNFQIFLSKNHQKTITEKTVQMAEIPGKMTEIPGTDFANFFEGSDGIFLL